MHSGWTQEALAAKKSSFGKKRSRPWIVCQLRFGGFLNFVTPVTNPESLPKNLSEGRFRSFWQRTEKAGATSSA